ncbi:hypothetical protein P5673_032540 [Acropora cervicornis]|uniref:Uncharacterized protein n=1 Tax=Acropora cervicornis TaxID=6130 RepID=A0AAD9URS1_ACRCE|nr:hypothetical protein P5673_032540 [Acropora cervicornis]
MIDVVFSTGNYLSSPGIQQGVQVLNTYSFSFCEEKKIRVDLTSGCWCWSSSTSDFYLKNPNNFALFIREEFFGF